MFYYVINFLMISLNMLKICFVLLIYLFIHVRLLIKKKKKKKNIYKKHSEQKN